MIARRNAVGLVLIGFVTVAPVALVACAGRGDTSRDTVAHGKELAVACQACHSPKILTDHGPVPDSTRAFSGHPQDLPIPHIDPDHLRSGWVQFSEDLTCWVGPWGVSFARNLTPDEDTGIGSWSEETFVRVLRAGRHLGSKHNLAQPMPWAEIGRLSDADLAAIYAYLRTVPPIRNRVPAPIPYESVAGLPKTD